jgi:Trehalose utilisation
MSGSQPFGSFQTFEILCGVGSDGVQVHQGGKRMGTRARTADTLTVDELTVGARFYSPSPVPAIRGFLDGDLAEIMLFDRILTPEERERVRDYLIRKHAGLTDTFARAGAGPARKVANPPPVQVLVPGFRVRELPLELPNINNIKYRHDGKLVALGYNGNIYLLSDTDGDGLYRNEGSLRAPIGDRKRIDVLATTPEEGTAQPLVWTRRHGKGRVFVSIPGHYSWTFDDPLFRLLVLRGLCWTAEEPVDRLSELITIGARMGD